MLPPSQHCSAGLEVFYYVSTAEPLLRPPPEVEVLRISIKKGKLKKLPFLIFKIKMEITLLKSREHEPFYDRCF